MDKFKNLIMILNNEKYQYDGKEELMQSLLGDEENDYNDMSETEKKERRRLKAYINLQGQEEYITNYKQDSLKKGKFPVNEKFLIDNDDMYIMSLLRMNAMVLLERKEANIFANKINKEDIDDNFLVLNGYADEITENYKKEVDQKNEERTSER